MRSARFFLLLAILALVSGCAGLSRKSPPPGAYQLLEYRDGRPTVRGVEIRLTDLTLNYTFGPGELQVVDLKSGRDMSKLLVWQMDMEQKVLTIQLRPEMGDFDSGNGIKVRIARSALLAPSSNLPEYLEFTIPSDRM